MVLAIGAVAGVLATIALWKFGAVARGFRPWPPLWVFYVAATIGAWLAHELGPIGGAAVVWPLAALLIGAVTDHERGVRSASRRQLLLKRPRRSVSSQHSADSAADKRS